MKSGHNKPPVVVELTKEQARFVVKNCDSNISATLNALCSGAEFSRSAQEALVDLMENFKGVKAAVEKAL